MVQWNPIAGCSFASPGSANCYPLSVADPELRKARSWSGETMLPEAALHEPGRLSEPSAIFVCNHGDLLHPATPAAWIDQVFAVMEACPQHAFQVLTKRAARMQAYIANRYAGGAAPAHVAIGVSAERQAELTERGRLLARTPARLKYLTLYPMLGPMDLSGLLGRASPWSAQARNRSGRRTRPGRLRWPRNALPPASPFTMANC
jgi:protein gp37